MYVYMYVCICKYMYVYSTFLKLVSLQQKAEKTQCWKKYKTEKQLMPPSVPSSSKIHFSALLNPMD